VPLTASAARQTITVTGTKVLFYASHLMLDADGHALLDDGVLHVTADHISLDLRSGMSLFRRELRRRKAS